MLLNKSKYNKDILLLSLLFGFGILYYCIFREPTILAQYLGIDTLNIFFPYKIYFNWFPSFIHTFVFVYLTWIVFDKEYENIAILLWSCVNIIFELMQGKNPILTTTWLPSFLQELFYQSTLSWDDIISIIVASIVFKVYVNFNKH